MSKKKHQQRTDSTLSLGNVAYAIQRPKQQQFRQLCSLKYFDSITDINNCILYLSLLIPTVIALSNNFISIVLTKKQEILFLVEPK